MARLATKAYAVGGPGFEDVRAYARHQDAVLAKLRQESATRPKKTLVGALLQFMVADGYAVYRVTKDKPLTLQHVPLWDGYRMDPVYIRGLTAADVRKRLEVESHFAKTFQPPTP